MSARPTGRGVGIAALGGVALIAAYAFGTEALVPLGVGLLALPVLAVALVALATAGLEPTRAGLGTGLRAGDLARVRGSQVAHRGRSRLASLLVLRTDARADLLGTVVERHPGEVVVRLERGVHDLPGPRLEALDPLGLARGVRAGTPAGQVVVAPKVVRLAPAAATACGFAGARRRALGAGTDLDRIREYRAGDPLSSVHWAQTAKRGSLQTKVLTGDHSGRRTVALTLEATGPSGDDGALFEESVTVAASLAHAILRDGAALRLEVRGGDAGEGVTTTSSRAVADRILALAKPRPPTASRQPPSRDPRRAIGQVVVTSDPSAALGRGGRMAGTTIVVGPPSSGSPRRQMIAVRRVEELAELLERREARVQAA